MTGRILVVDDDPDVRELVGAVLTEASFTVVEAASADDALAVMPTVSDLLLLLTDIRMPGMNGIELAERAKKTSPGLRVLFMSGYAAEYKIDTARQDFISKPFQPRELLGCVYELIRREQR
jgi:CheY-like chemotaxis protein